MKAKTIHIKNPSEALLKFVRTLSERKEKRINEIRKDWCSFFGHDWRYNFPINSMPTRSICFRCNAKQKLDLFTLEWENVDSFYAMLGTDDELKNRWFK